MEHLRPFRRSKTSFISGRLFGFSSIHCLVSSVILRPSRRSKSALSWKQRSTYECLDLYSFTAQLWIALPVYFSLSRALLLVRLKSKTPNAYTSNFTLYAAAMHFINMVRPIKKKKKISTRINKKNNELAKKQLMQRMSHINQMIVYHLPLTPIPIIVLLQRKCKLSIYAVCFLVAVWDILLLWNQILTWIFV